MTLKQVQGDRKKTFARAFTDKASQNFKPLKGIIQIISDTNSGVNQTYFPDISKTRLEAYLLITFGKAQKIFLPVTNVIKN